MREEGGFDRLLDVLGVTPIDETPLRMLVRTRRRLTWLQRPGWIFLFAFTPSRAWSERPLRRRFVSDLFRSAAKDRAEQVLAEHDIQTLVAAEFYDEFLAALDAPTQPNPALSPAAGRVRDLVTG